MLERVLHTIVTMSCRRPPSPTLNLPIDLRQEDPDVKFVRQQGLITFSGDLISCGFDMLNQGRVVAAARLFFLAYKGLAGVSTYLEEAEITKRQLQKIMEENLSEELEKAVQEVRAETEMSAKIAAAEATTLNTDVLKLQHTSPTTGREEGGKKKKKKKAKPSRSTWVYR